MVDGAEGEEAEEEACTSLPPSFTNEGVAEAEVEEETRLETLLEKDAEGEQLTDFRHPQPQHEEDAEEGSQTELRVEETPRGEGLPEFFSLPRLPLPPRPPEGETQPGAAPTHPRSLCISPTERIH